MRVDDNERAHDLQIGVDVVRMWKIENENDHFPPQ